jgi:TetR/AcrR family transcriptional regulator, transcriptional repressor for nem operon
MARPREFDRDVALDRAMAVFWAKGFTATSTSDLTEAMRIGRQSMYDSFGDKRTLYLEALEQYQRKSVDTHIARLQSGKTALAGIEAMLAGVAPDNKALRLRGCMGVSAIVEFGCDDPDVVQLREKSGATLAHALTAAVKLAKQQGDIPPQVDTAHAVRFIGTVMHGLQTDARAGARPEVLRATAGFSIAALTRR